jgi:hypothetical protein
MPTLSSQGPFSEPVSRLSVQATHPLTRHPVLSANPMRAVRANSVSGHARHHGILAPPSPPLLPMPPTAAGREHNPGDVKPPQFRCFPIGEMRATVTACVCSHARRTFR